MRLIVWGDCGEMLRTGSPFWSLLAFGMVAMFGGLFCWHKPGSVKEFLAEPERVDPQLAYTTFAVVVAIVVAEIVAPS